MLFTCCLHALPQACTDAGVGLRRAGFLTQHPCCSFYPGAPMKHCAGAVMLAAVVDGTFGPVSGCCGQLQ